MTGKKKRRESTFLERQLYDALDRLMDELYADGPTRAAEQKANRALNRFDVKYGNRHDAWAKGTKWEQFMTKELLREAKE